MFNSVVLNVVIGLVFIYLLYSLLATIIQEIIAANLGMRSRMLKKGICRMLDDDVEDNEPLSKVFYKHPLIKYLGENKLFKKPSYISAQNFSKVLIDLLRGENAQPGQNFASLIQTSLKNEEVQWGGIKIKINPETLSFLKSLWADAQGDVEKYKSMLEQWFDDTMERVTGWYKRRVQWIMLCIGLFLAFAFNIDSISIAIKLSKDPKLAEQLANNASAYIQTHKELGNQLKADVINQNDSNVLKNITKSGINTISENMVLQSFKLIDTASIMIKADIDNSNKLLGLGWHCIEVKHTDSTNTKNSNTGKEFKNKFRWVPVNFHKYSIFGWLITALAISLGAPFWFDLLNKFINLRNAGKNPDNPAVQTTKSSEVPNVKRVG
jgi:hypothetical protein